MRHLTHPAALTIACGLLAACAGQITVPEDFAECGSTLGGLLCDPGKECRQGRCRWSAERCSPATPDGPCGARPDNRARVCVAGVCQDQGPLPCDAENPLGDCGTDAVCLGGACQPASSACAPTQPNGYCPAGARCIGGGCFPLDESELCSPQNLTGLCPNGFHCDGGACFVIVFGERCSSQNPTGLCGAWEECVDGTCSDPVAPDVCSAAFPAGRCPLGAVCIAGQCQDLDTRPCGLERLDGFCAPGFSCLEGECVPLGDRPCSPKFPTGLCAAGAVCQAGVCVVPSCSSAVPWGACPGTSEICQDGTCQGAPCSVFFPTGTCDGDRYCDLGECTPYACGPGHPAGVCPEGQVCNGDACTEVPCSPINATGTCPAGATCVDDDGRSDFGRCVPRCAAGTPTGYCHAGQECVLGSCVEPCPTGPRCGAGGACCDVGDTCQGGVCAPPISCTPDQLVCISARVLGRCAASGDGFVPVTTCGRWCDPVAVPDSCACDAASDCPLAAACDGSHCLFDVCTPGNFLCTTAGSIGQCNPWGTAVDPVIACRAGCRDDLGAAQCTCGTGGNDDCVADEHCASGICNLDQCVQGTEYCVDDQVWACNFEGSAGSVLADCASGCVDDLGGAGCACGDDWDCPPGQGCDVNVCVSTSGQCRLAPQAFSGVVPRVEIGWGGAERGLAGTYDPMRLAYGSPFPWHAQSVMMPLVINLDDDNGDGRINERDFPEIVFVTFAAADAYFYDGVLRAIHGGGPHKGRDAWAACGATTWREPRCGDDVCETSEDCPADCAPACGDGLCDAASEAVGRCPKDCVPSVQEPVCGDLQCTLGEGPASCALDCPATCGDRVCAPSEPAVCQVDCHDAATDPLCGDGVCAGLETLQNCSVDCLPCHLSPNSPADLDATANLAAGDLDGDGRPEIVAVVHDEDLSDRYLRIYDNTGRILLTYTDRALSGENPSVVLADLDRQAPAEVIIGAKVFLLKVENGVWSVTGYFSANGSSGLGFNDSFGPVVCVADLVGDEGQEIVAGDMLYRMPPNKQGANLELVWRASQNGTVLHAGSSQGSSTSVIRFAGTPGLTPHAYQARAMLRVLSGAYRGFSRPIVDNDAASVTVAPPLPAALADGDSLVIGADQVGRGDTVFTADVRATATVAAGSWAGRVYAAGLSPVWRANQWTNGFSVRLLTGALAGQIRHVISSGRDYLNLSPALGGAPAAGDTFAIVSDLEGSHDGFCAVADLLGADGAPVSRANPPDGRPEVIVVTKRNPARLELFDGPTGVRQVSLYPPGSDSHGGAPNIADFDADGFAEIGYADANKYQVVDLQPSDDCTDVGCSCPAWPVCGDGAAGGQSPADLNSARSPSCTANGWCSTTQDGSSRSTGSSVFDLNGDGAVEVVYNDECHFRVYQGRDGRVLYIAESPSRTASEYPLVADVDNDGNAEIVFVTSNESGFCGANGGDPGIDARSNNGLEVWGDPSDRWVSARRIWNQHPYHITNVTEGGQIPTAQEPSWLFGNSYRRNQQGSASGIPAPDLIPAEGSVAGLGGACGALGDRVEVMVLVANAGELRVGPGVPLGYIGHWNASGHSVRLLDELGAPLSGRLLATLEPGGSAYVTVVYDVAFNPPGESGLPDTIEVWVDDPALGGGEAECHEDNNALMFPVAAGSNLAELTARIVAVNDQICQGCGQRPTATVEVTNGGSADALNFKLRFYAGSPSQGGYPIHEVTVPLVAGGATVTVGPEPLDGDGLYGGFPFQVPVRLNVWVNPTQAVSECNYANNVSEVPPLGCYCGG